MIEIEMINDARHFAVRAPSELHVSLVEIGGSHFNSFKDEYTYPATTFCAQAIRYLAERSRIKLITSGDAFSQLTAKYDAIKPLRERLKNASALPQPTTRKHDSWVWQLEGYHAHLGLDANMDWMGVGTGKSKIVVDEIQNCEYTKIVLAMPNHILKDDQCWDKHFENFSVNEYMLEVLNYGSSKQNINRFTLQSKRFAGSKVPLIIAVNYESIWRGALAEALIAWQPDLLALDESHKIKAPGGKASRYIARLGMSSRRRAALTGTLMPNSQLDVYGQYRALDPGIFGTSFNRFRDEYAVIYNHNGVPIVQGYKNQQQLAAKIAPITVQVDAKVLDLPEPIHDSRVFDLSDDERRVYDDIEQTYGAETQQGYITVTNGLTKILRLQQLTGGWLPLREDDVEAQLKRIGDSKQRLLRDLMEDIPAEEPIVVYARFKADLDSIRQAAHDLKRSYGEISGRAYDKELWDKGQLQILGLQVQAGSGIDTLKRAQYGIFYSVGYSNGDFEQCVGRLRRPGMRNFCYFYHLVGRNTVDVTVYKALKSKQNVKEQIIGYLRTLKLAA
jgi:hypothetical protein